MSKYLLREQFTWRRCDSDKRAIEIRNANLCGYQQMPLFVWSPDSIVHGICTQTILYYWEIYVCIVLWRSLIFSTALITHSFRLCLGAQEFQCCLYNHGTQPWWFVLFLFWSAAPSSLSHLNHVYCCVRTREPASNVEIGFTLILQRRDGLNTN